MESEIYLLKSRIEKLEKENVELKSEISFLKTHPVFVKGFKGEQLVCDLTSGSLTSFAVGHDVVLKNGSKIEVKYSKLVIPNLNGTSRRWQWSKPLGFMDKGKDYNFLLLVGDKDYRFQEQYLDESPYVFFLIPIENVKSLMSFGKAIGSSILLTTKFSTYRSEKAKQILKYMVAEQEINKVLAATG